MMKAGYARIDITPEKSMKMAGYDRRSGRSAGVLDPLYVSVVVIGNETPDIAVCSFDLLGVDMEFCSEFRQLVSNSTGIPERHVIVCATHTHSGPSGIYAGRVDYDREYVKRLISKGTTAVKYAVADFSDANISYLPLKIKGIASLRNTGRLHNSESYGMDAGVVLFTREKGPIRICKFTCHPTVLNEQNMLYSRDLPGAAARFMDGGESTVFLNGPCADLSTRFTRRGSNPQELARLGRLWADAVNGLCKDIPGDKSVSVNEHSNNSINVYNSKVYLPGRTGLSSKDRLNWMKELEERIINTPDEEEKREYLSRLAVLERGEYTSCKGREINIDLVDLSCIVLLCLPVELGSETGAEFRLLMENELKRPAFIVCYAGGYEGYIPSGEPLTIESSYEDFASPYSREAKSILLNELDKLLKYVKGKVESV
ncbi:MAG TPA: hypothetical protein GX505_01735 [Clostridiales bacterium]|nr:hypothetical protein [Clostridiales bacterium]